MTTVRDLRKVRLRDASPQTQRAQVLPTPPTVASSRFYDVLPSLPGTQQTHGLSSPMPTCVCPTWPISH
ncbi:hypothetical protein GQ53DRAFT_754315 [Thozetella sp. PMI_491]|nr:hypothetical protein GQ53DRAFT_754315 [Thozetella sp. PMI_491]